MFKGFISTICSVLFLLVVLKINLTVSQCSHGDIRLVGGLGDYEGNVQLCKNGTWGYVCDYYWYSNNAIVACRQLGYSATDAYRRRDSYFGYSVNASAVWLEYFMCIGGESRLTECPTRLSYWSCGYNSFPQNIAGLFCASGKNCSNGAVRLAIASSSSGYGRSEGEVQVCYNNQWGSVCSNGWTATNANVVCKQLGYSGWIGYKRHYYFNTGSVPIWFDRVSCSSDSTTLIDCQHQLYVPSTYNTCRRVGIRCFAIDNSSCIDGNVQLWSSYDFTPDNEGIPLVCIDETWYPMRDDGYYSYSDNCYSLELACKAAGYGGLEYYTSNAGRFYGYYEQHHYSYLCWTHHTSLSSCSKYKYYYYNWDDSYGVRCFRRREVQCNRITESTFRLVNGKRSNEGRVEYCYNGYWTPMCHLSGYTANVICKELGYITGNTLIFDNHEFGRSDYTSRRFDYLRCQRTSTNSLQCSVQLKSFCSSSCNVHYGLRCYEPTNECANGGVRLVDGNIEQEGRVEVCVNGIWSQICSDGWSVNDAYVACVSLGYTGNSINPTHHLYSTEFGIGYGPIIWSEVNCYHWNRDLHDCIKDVYPFYQCGGTLYIAGVRCTEGCIDGEVRLVGGNSDVHEGTVEICYDELWGLISDDGWSDDEAKVVCKQLGFSGEDSKSIAASFYGKPKKTIHLKQVNCSSYDNSLLYCNNTRLSLDDGKMLLPRTDVAGVNCLQQSVIVHGCLNTFDSCLSNGSIRLIGNRSKDEGLVEYCKETSWTPLCHIDNKAATVICRQLGYTSYSWGSIIFNTNNKPYSLLEADISCSGHEAKLSECNNNSLPVVQNGCIKCFKHSIGLRCFNLSTTTLCDEGSVRLVNGTSDREGRVEVCVNGVWGSVCDSEWDSIDGFVVCQQLGYTREEPTLYHLSHFGDGSYPIVYSNINCKGWEDSISDCDKDDYLSFICYPGHTAGLKCNGQYVPNASTAEAVATEAVITEAVADSDSSYSTVIGITSSLFIIVVVIFISALVILFFIMKKWSKVLAQGTDGTVSTDVSVHHSEPPNNIGHHHKHDDKLSAKQDEDIPMNVCPVYEDMNKLSYEADHSYSYVVNRR